MKVLFSLELIKTKRFWDQFWLILKGFEVIDTQNWQIFNFLGVRLNKKLPLMLQEITIF